MMTYLRRLDERFTFCKGYKLYRIKATHLIIGSEFVCGILILHSPRKQ